MLKAFWRTKGHNQHVFNILGENEILEPNFVFNIAHCVEKELYYWGIRKYVLDGDNVRQRINSNFGFSSENGKENNLIGGIMIWIYFRINQ